jgi:hypothetical protein
VGSNRFFQPLADVGLTALAGIKSLAKLNMVGTEGTCARVPLRTIDSPKPQMKKHASECVGVLLIVLT